MACSITTLLDLNTLSVEELIGRLKASEECDEEEVAESRASGKLLLSKEEWFAWLKLEGGGPGSSSSQAGRTRGRGRGRGRGRFPATQRRGNRDTLRNTCHYCGVAGHWARDCRKKKREEAHLVQGVDEDDAALLMMQACTFSESPIPQLHVPTRPRAESGTSVPTTPTRPVVESATLPVAESEEESTSTRPVVESATLLVVESEEGSAPTQLQIGRASCRERVYHPV